MGIEAIFWPAITGISVMLLWWGFVDSLKKQWDNGYRSGHAHGLKDGFARGQQAESKAAEKQVTAEKDEWEAGFGEGYYEGCNDGKREAEKTLFRRGYLEGVRQAHMLLGATLARLEADNTKEDEEFVAMLQKHQADAEAAWLRGNAKQGKVNDADAVVTS